MVETTSHTEEVSREEAAKLLEELADELHGDGPADVRVGNKRVQLTPAAVLEYGIDVEERSPPLGSDYQGITMTLQWQPDEDG
ncbi:amphi-Trp domain-containing protein [Natrialbaceae archaeon A-gly3]